MGFSADLGFHVPEVTCSKILLVIQSDYMSGACTGKITALLTARGIHVEIHALLMLCASGRFSTECMETRPSEAFALKVRVKKLLCLF